MWPDEGFKERASDDVKKHLKVSNDTSIKYTEFIFEILLKIQFLSNLNLERF